MKPALVALLIAAALAGVLAVGLMPVLKFAGTIVVLAIVLLVPALVFAAGK